VYFHTEGEEAMKSKKTDIDKKHYWQRMIREATRSKLSIREFCRRNHVRESQYFWWQRKLNGNRRPKEFQKDGNKRNGASFALVSNDPEATDAGIELILQDGRRLRISRGVDEQTLRSVLAAVETTEC
jgi:transposase-like protein